MRFYTEIKLEALGKQSSLYVEVEFDATPGEPMVRYYPDGSGYPGSPPNAELTGVRVLSWDIDGEIRKRGDPWLWKELDRIAIEIISNKWDETYRDNCIDDVIEQGE